MRKREVSQVMNFVSIKILLYVTENPLCLFVYGGSQSNLPFYLCNYDCISEISHILFNFKGVS